MSTLQVRRLIIDPRISGVSGDMLLGALIDLGADSKKIGEALAKLASHISDCKSIRLKTYKTSRREISATKAEILIDEKLHPKTGGTLKRSLQSYLKASSLSGEAKRFCVNALNLILEAEAKIHGSTPKKVELHELASADTLADIVGVAEALSQLKAFKAEIYSLPVVVGSGYVKVEHGVIPVPLPATLEILRMKGFPFKLGGGQGELSTPTGVAILTALAKPLSLAEPLEAKASRVGYGAGSRRLKDQPNLLRIWIEEAESAEAFRWDEIYVLETSLDDVNGEILGSTIESLMAEGALDVNLTFGVGKKSRPTQTLKVLVNRENFARVLKTVFSETGTLGVRIQKVSRVILEREVAPIKVNVSGKTFIVRIKKAWTAEGETLKVKPEFEDVKRVAKETGLPLRLVFEKISSSLKYS
jgi:hypothetical protein